MENGCTIITPDYLGIDEERIAPIRRKRDYLKGNGKLMDRKQQLMEIFQHYALSNEVEDPNDTLTLSQRLENAWDVLSTHDFKSEEITPVHIINVARNLTYVNQQRCPHFYRQYPMESPRKLDNEGELESLMGGMLYNANSIEEPITKALYLHFEIFYFQPTMNGNKRLGQLISGKVLSDNGYAIPFVPHTDFQRYTNLLLNAANEIDEGKSPDALNYLVDYLLQRVETSLEILQESTELRNFEE